MIFVLWAAAAGVMLHNVIPRPRIGGRGKGRFVVADLSQDYFTAFWMWVEKYIRAIRRVRERYAAYLRVYGGGIPYDYDAHARKAVHLALTLSPLVAAPIADVRLFMLALCPIVMIYPLMQLSSRVKQRKIQIEEEMSFFLAYLTTMQGVGYTLYTALESVRDAPDVFAQLAQDAAIVTQKVVLGIPHMDALREYAKNHPVQQFKDFLHGYISKHETVGPVPSYTETKAEQFFELYQQTWIRYKEAALMLCTMAVICAVMIPIMMVMMIFISTPATTNMILTMGPILGPVLCVMMLFMVQSSQPSTGVKLKPWLPGIGVGAAAVVAVHILWVTYIVPGGGIWDTEPGITISIGFLAGAISNYVMVRQQIGGASNVDRGLPEFLEDVYEQTLAGSDISTILRQQTRSRLYSGLFGRLLNGIVSKLEMGSTMQDACVEARKHSRYLSFVLLIIIRLQEIGGTANTPSILRQMTHFMSSILITKMDVTKSLRMGAMMIYASPLMLVGIMNAMFAIFADSGTATNTLSTVLPPGMMEGFGPPDPDAAYRERLGLIAALLTCPMGLVAAKITRFTSVDTMPVIIVAVVNILAIMTIPILIEALL